MQRESGWDNISSCLAWSDWNEPSDLVSKTPSVFPSRTSSRNQAANFTSVLIPKACVMCLWFLTAASQPDASVYFTLCTRRYGWVSKSGAGLYRTPAVKNDTLGHIGKHKWSADPWRYGGAEEASRCLQDSHQPADPLKNISTIYFNNGPYQVSLLLTLFVHSAFHKLTISAPCVISPPLRPSSHFYDTVLLS